MVEVDLKALLDPRTLVGGGRKLAERFGDEAYFAAVCVRSGMVGPELPHKIAQMLLAFERHGMLAGRMKLTAFGSRSAALALTIDIATNPLRTSTWTNRIFSSLDVNLVPCAAQPPLPTRQRA